MSFITCKSRKQNLPIVIEGFFLVIINRYFFFPGHLCSKGNRTTESKWRHNFDESSDAITKFDLLNELAIHCSEHVKSEEGPRYM